MTPARLFLVCFSCFGWALPVCADDAVPVGNGNAAIGRRHLRSIPTGRSSVTVAYIGPFGNLHFHTGRRGNWQYRETLPKTGLIPGAPLVLRLDDRSLLPLVYTINAAGEIVEIASGTESRTLSLPAFPLGGSLELFSEGRNDSVVAVNNDGQLWQTGITRNAHHPIAQPQHRCPPGAPVVTFNLANRVEVYAVDERGALVRYTRPYGQGLNGPPRGWSGPTAVANGYGPGAHLDSVLATDPRDPNITLQLIAASNAQNRIQVVRVEGGRASIQMLGPAIAGAPVSIDLPADASQTMLTCMVRGGEWIDTVSGGQQAALSTSISAGFPEGGVMEMSGFNGPGFAFDAQGRLIMAEFDPAARRWVLLPIDLPALEPGILRQPRLVASEFVPNPPLEPVDVAFTNSHTEALVIKVIDRTNPRAADAQEIPRGSSTTVRLNRDAGGQVVEVWEFPVGLDGWGRQEKAVPVPPQVLYDVAVFENKETYRVIGRFQQKGFSMNSLVSVGVFEIAPGNEIVANTKIATYQDAKRSRNPGATARFGPLE